MSAAQSAGPPQPAPARPPAAPREALGRLRPRLTLRTLSRGDGLLGMRPGGLFGPRGSQVTLAEVDWTYLTADGVRWECPAPAGDEAIACATAQLIDRDGLPLALRRDRHGEALALELLSDTGLRLVPDDALQWRAPEVALTSRWWSLLQEEQFGDFWADQVPLLQRHGWSIVVRPGFAHLSVPVEAWHILVDPATGAELGQEVASRLGARPLARVRGSGPGKAAWWLLTLGVELDGQLHDLAPMLADLLKRDPRWVDLRQLAAIDGQSQVSLRAPAASASMRLPPRSRPSCKPCWTC